MGLLVDRERFEPSDYRRFSARLKECLAALREVLSRPGFGVGPRSLGAELEMFLIDGAGQVLPRNSQVLGRTGDPRVTLEFGSFNMEVNATPVPFEGRPFTALGRGLEELLAEVRRAAAAEGARVAVIGILPTLSAEQLGRSAMTQRERYRALSEGILQHRGTPVQLHIDGEDRLSLEWDEATLLGANTSFQFHLRVDPGDFARVHNAAQVATAPVLALAGNSPIFLGHRLWEETRIALFKQASDLRGELPIGWHPAARVSFGHGWVREGIHELFEESVALHPPLLPVMDEEEPLAAVRGGAVPRLAELRLHNGTVWMWNRAVYDPAAGGHVRIEFRPFPAGPTMQDMLANCALMVGLTLGLAGEMDWMLPALPFEYAKCNFYRAAQYGLDAELLWPTREAPSPRPIPVQELLPGLLPVAERGLREAGVESGELSALLGLIADRLARRMTGARWQRQGFARRERSAPRPEALRQMLERYLELARGGLPVHQWPLD